MSQNQKTQQQQNPTEKLKWEKNRPTKGIFELLQPIIGSFVLLIEEERKRTIDQLEKTKDTLENLRNNR